MGGKIPGDLAQALRDKYGLSVAIETGTYKAGSTRWLGNNFDIVYSIEMCDRWYQSAREKVATYHNIHLVHGDSRDQLPELLSDLGDTPALLWLDAHWCGGVRDNQKPEEECPLLEELAAVRESSARHHVLIDDARFFLGIPEYLHDPTKWPSIDEVIRALPEDYHVRICRDVIAAVPNECSAVVDAWAGGTLDG